MSLVTLPSSKAIMNFATVNLFIGGLGYAASTAAESGGLIATIGVEVAKTAILVSVISFITDSKEPICSVQDANVVDLQMMGTVGSIAALKGGFHYLILRNAADLPPLTLVSFTLNSFLFEVVFDFCHYWMHRLAHMHPLVYRWTHKRHHRYNHPTLLAGYYMSPVDMMLTYCLPFTIATTFTSINTATDLNVLMTYLAFQEFSGHLGKKMAPASSFVQFMWLPRLLGIELYTEDHDLHHTLSTVNYSKRFALWDKVFGTYRKGITSSV